MTRNTFFCQKSVHAYHALKNLRSSNAQPFLTKLINLAPLLVRKISQKPALQFYKNRLMHLIEMPDPNSSITFLNSILLLLSVSSVKRLYLDLT